MKVLLLINLILSDVVTCLRNFITNHVKSVVQSDGDDCEDKMNKVELKLFARIIILQLTSFHPLQKCTYYSYCCCHAR